MLLVHGWGADIRTNWMKPGWIDALQNHRTLVAVDIRGHGNSDKPAQQEVFSYAAMSRDVLAVMDVLELNQADYMGYSMGAFMGAWLLGHHPQRFTSMVLGGIGNETATTAAQGSIIARALRAQGPSALPDPAAAAIRSFVESNPSNNLLSLACSAEEMWPQGYPLELAGAGIRHATFPVLVVNGTNDHPYVDSADMLADALPQGRHVTIQDVDHLSTVADARFKQIVLDFLNQPFPF